MDNSSKSSQTVQENEVRVSADNVFLVTGYVDDITKLTNQITYGADAKDAVDAATKAVAGFNLVSVASLSTIEQTAAMIRAEVKKAGIIIA